LWNQAVDQRHPGSHGEQFSRQVRTDEAQAAGDQDFRTRNGHVRCHPNPFAEADKTGEFKTFRAAVAEFSTRLPFSLHSPRTRWISLARSTVHGVTWLLASAAACSTRIMPD